jgi:hypothetical protein
VIPESIGREIAKALDELTHGYLKDSPATAPQIASAVAGACVSFACAMFQGMGASRDELHHIVDELWEETGRQIKAKGA